MSNRLFSFPCFLLVLALFVFTGCTDSVMTPEAPAVVNDLGLDQQIEQLQSDKLRNAHLFNRATRKGGSGKFGNEETLNLVISINKQSVVERYAVLERFKNLERYEIIDRYEYNNVIGGYAITIEDSLGMSEYWAFLEALENDPDISWYEPDFLMEMPDSETGEGGVGQEVPWSVAAIGATGSWAISGDGMGVVETNVFLLDTGVAKANPSDPYDDLRLGESVNVVASPSGAQDMDGHGTHIAGIIGAADDGDGLVGVAPGAIIHNGKVLNDDGTADVSVLIAAIELITVLKQTHPTFSFVVNLSLGEHTGSTDYTALDYAIEASAEAGVIYVVAAGNHGDDVSQVTPARVPGVITVGSYDSLGFYSSFSNYGPLVDILAPGEGIVSLSKDGTSAGKVEMSGTSMAAAHVTGAVALYIAHHPMATPAEVEAHLKSRAQSFVIGAPRGTTKQSVWVGH